MSNPIFSGRLHPGGSGVYRPTRDTTGAPLTINGVAPQWADNSAETFAEFAKGALPTADFAAQSTVLLDMAGEVYAHGTGGCAITLFRKSTGMMLAVSTACAYGGGGWSAGNQHTWESVFEDPNAALTEGDLCVEASHSPGVFDELVKVTDLAFDYTIPAPPPGGGSLGSGGGGPRRGPRVFPLKSQQWTNRRGPGSFY